MKKIDLKSLLIGFLSCLVVMLTMSLKPVNNSSDIGRYQGWGTNKKKHLIDTSTGVLYYQTVNVHRRWQRVSAEDVFAE